MSYVLMFPAFAVLRRRFPDAARPFTLPFGKAGLLVAAVVTTAWVALGTWIAVFPGTVDHALGQSYDFAGTWSMSRGRFELFTLGTLLVIATLGVVGYALSAATRGAAAETISTPDLA
jgi:hypothetical protein